MRPYCVSPGGAARAFHPSPLCECGLVPCSHPTDLSFVSVKRILHPFFHYRRLNGNFIQGLQLGTFKGMANLETL